MDALMLHDTGPRRNPSLSSHAFLNTLCYHSIAIAGLVSAQYMVKPFYLNAPTPPVDLCKGIALGLIVIAVFINSLNAKFAVSVMNFLTYRCVPNDIKRHLHNYIISV